MVPAMSYGAPASLAMQAKRTVEQEALVMHVKQFEREARRLVKELEGQPIVNRQALFSGEALLAAGLMLMVRAITRDEMF